MKVWMHSIMAKEYFLPAPPTPKKRIKKDLLRVKLVHFSSYCNPLEPSKDLLQTASTTGSLSLNDCNKCVFKALKAQKAKRRKTSSTNIAINYYANYCAYKTD